METGRPLGVSRALKETTTSTSKTSAMRKKRKLQRLGPSARDRSMEETIRIVLSASEKPLSAEQAARVANTLLADYEAVRARAARKGIEFAQVNPAEILDRFAKLSACGEVSVPQTQSSGGERERASARRDAVQHERTVVVPRQPGSWVLTHSRFPLEKYRYVPEGVDVVEAAGVDQTHKEVADTGAVGSAVE